MNKILKYISTTFLTSALIAAASTSLPTVLAEGDDITTMNLAVQAGAREVVAPESVALDDKNNPTPGNEQVTLSSVDEIVSSGNSFKAAGNGAILVRDLSGTGNGWGLNMRVENLSSSANEEYYNVLMGDTIDTDGDGSYSGNSFLTITTDNASRNSGSPLSELRWSDTADITGANNPVYDELDLISYDGARGSTNDIPLLKAPSGAGMGEYVFDLLLDIDIPAYGDYGLSDGQAIKADTYSGIITFDLI